MIIPAGTVAKAICAFYVIFVMANIYTGAVVGLLQSAEGTGG